MINLMQSYRLLNHLGFVQVQAAETRIFMNIIQCYAPTSDSNDLIKEFHNQLQSVIQRYTERDNASQSIKQSKPVTPRGRWDTPTDASAGMAEHLRQSSATRSSDDIDWPVHSLRLSFHDLGGLPLRRLPSTDPCSMIFAAYHGDRVGRTTITCDV